MKQILYIIIIFSIISGCSVKKGNFTNSYFSSIEIYNEYYELIKGTNFDSGIVDSVKIYHINMNRRGKIIDSVLIDNENTIIEITRPFKIIRDSLGRITEEYEKTNDTTVYLSIKNIFGKNGKVKESTVYNFKGDFISRNTFKYNSVHSLIHKEYYRWSELCLQHTYDFYYSNHKLVKTIEKRTVKDCQDLDFVITKEYNGFGKIQNIKYVLLNPNDNKIYKYYSYSKYDERGSLIETIVKNNGQIFLTSKYYYYPNGLPKEIQLSQKKREKLNSLRRFYYKD